MLSDFIRTFIVENSRSNSLDMKNLCYDNIMIKKGLSGNMFYGIEYKKKISEKNISTFLNFIQYPMYEYLHANRKTKIYLDCEFDNVEIEKFDKRFDLYIKFDNLFKKYLHDNKINNFNIIYLDASRKKNDKYKISLHAITNDAGVFNDRKILKKFIENFKNSLTEEFNMNNINFVDTKVYNVPQLFKIVLSPSKDDNTLLKPFIILDNKIKFIENDYIYNNFTDFLVGDYKDSKNILDNIFPQFEKEEKVEKKIISKEINNNFHKNYNKIPNWKIKWIERNNFVKNIYKIRDNTFIDNKINLQRIRPSFCKLCSREHNSENAFCKIEKNNIIFYCGRNKKGITIGSWYDNSNNSSTYFDKINLSELKILKNENIRLNDELEKIKKNNDNLILINKNLLEELNRIKKEKNIPHNKKCVEPHSYNWNKYYLLGKNIIENNSFIIENIIGSWREKNVSKLKTRALRIVQYLDLIKSKGIENKLSLRKIFHLKNYEFSNLLSSL